MRVTAGCNTTTYPHLFSLIPDDRKVNGKIDVFQ